MTLKTVFASTLLAACLAEEVPVALASPQGIRYEPAIMRADRSTPGPEFVPVVRRSRRRYVARRRVVVRRRSTRKSAAIVGGSALAGAAIGGLAGGGKGAAIGALAGGGAGYVYDRKTHKKVVRQY